MMSIWFNTVGTLAPSVWSTLFSSIDGTLVFTSVHRDRVSVRFVPDILDWYSTFKLPKVSRTMNPVRINHPNKQRIQWFTGETGYVTTIWFTDYSSVLVEMSRWVHRSYK